jgi:hypothetical protein
MGDISEMRGLIVCVTFIATAITLVMIIPTGFFPSTNATQQVNPQGGAFRDILGYNDTYQWNFTGNYFTGIYPNLVPARGVTDKSVKIGGWTVVITESWYEVPNDPAFGNGTGYYFELQMEICDEWWDFRYNREDFQWFNQNGTESTSNHDVKGAIGGNFEVHKVLTIPRIDIDSRSSSYGNNTYSPETSYDVRCSRTSFYITFYYNCSLYPPPAAPSSAYYGQASPTHDCGLAMSIGQGFSERATQLNAWTLITGFLFFQLIPDLPIIISLLIECPIWICEAYLLFIFVLRVIGAVFGGGGA